MKIQADIIVNEARENLPSLLESEGNFHEFMEVLENYQRLSTKMQNLEVKAFEIRRQLVRVSPDITLFKALLEKEELTNEETLMVINLYASLIVARTHFDDIEEMKAEVERMAKYIDKHKWRFRGT